MSAFETGVRIERYVEDVFAYASDPLRPWSSRPPGSTVALGMR
jgi:hypothetical protein